MYFSSIVSLISSCVESVMHHLVGPTGSLILGLSCHICRSRYLMGILQ